MQVWLNLILLLIWYKMKYSTFVYGSGVLYGPTIDFTDVLPASGPSTGGQDIVILGEGFDYTDFDDDFTGVALDGAKWTDISAGTGSVSTGAAHLELATGAVAGGLGGIEMQTTFDNTQYECKVNIPKPIVYPLSEVHVFTMQLYADANNYSDISIILSTDKSFYLEVSITHGGSVVETYRDLWTYGVSTFKILNWTDDTYFYANGALFVHSKKHTRALDTWRFFSTNDAATYEMSGVIVEYVECRPFMMFDTNPVSNVTVVSDYRIRGVTPPSTNVYGKEGAYAGLVDVSVIAGKTSYDVDAYTYYFVDELIALDNVASSVKVNIVGDSVIKTPVTAARGLGEGI